MNFTVVVDCFGKIIENIDIIKNEMKNIAITQIVNNNNDAAIELNIKIIPSTKTITKEKDNEEEKAEHVVYSVESCLNHIAQLYKHDDNIGSVIVIGQNTAFTLRAHISKVYYFELMNEYDDENATYFNLLETFGCLESGGLVLNQQIRTDYYMISTYSLQQTTGLHEEYQYLDLVDSILKNGIKREDRTNVGTLSIFSPKTMRFSLENDRVPILTTKYVAWKVIAKELLWFMQGHTDAKLLTNTGVHIWDGNSSREFLDQQGFYGYDTGVIGPGYGWQWRFSGGEYKNEYANVNSIRESEIEKLKGSSVDQLKELIDGIIQNPYSRRHILCSWNPKDIKKMALPPCHVLAQFYVSPHRQLSCHLYMRSSDVFLGLPFNIASYAMLTVIISQYTNTSPSELFVTLGDAHLYINHIQQAQELFKGRFPYEFPRIEVECSDKEERNNRFEDISIEVKNYLHHSSIRAPMAV